MPQLDKFSYFSQIVWLLALLFLIYSFLISWVLPQTARILKFRNKYVGSLVGGSDYSSSSRLLLTGYRSLVKKSLDLSSSLTASVSTDVASFKEVNSFKINNSGDFVNILTYNKEALKNLSVRSFILKNN